MSAPDGIFAMPVPACPVTAEKGPPVRVLVVDADPIVREAIGQKLEQAAETDVCAAVATAEDAFDALATLSPDIVILHDELPGMSGLQVTRAIMVRRPTPILIATDMRAQDSDLAFECLRSGALGLLSRVPSDLSSPALVERIVAITQAARPSRAQPSTLPPKVAPPFRPADLLCFLVAEGGLGAVLRLLDGMPAKPAQSVLLAVSIPAILLAPFVAWLNDAMGQSVVVADISGRTTLATGVVHVLSASDLAQLAPGPRVVSMVRKQEEAADPAARSFDVLLASLAGPVARQSCVVLMGHAGTAGAAGLLLVHQAGGQTLAEYPSLCPFAGAPGAAVRMDAVDAIGTADELAEALSRLPAVESSPDTVCI
ncbi:chemotaxis protein CheB [Acetobacter estunensis]|uniref:chemotaxis protein CheB n=1 Tax=Acetobacter estunensis TaxID=104097 RepID=UPI00140CCA6F